MCETEQKVHDALVDAWHSFVRLPPTHGDDITDFRRAIHECQRILAVRELRRIDPAMWPSYHHVETKILCFKCKRRFGMDCAGRGENEATLCITCLDELIAKEKEEDNDIVEDLVENPELVRGKDKE